MRIHNAWCLLLVVFVALGCRSNSRPDPGADEQTTAAVGVHPIVDAREHQLFGASQGEQWLTAERAAQNVRSGQHYRIYGLTDTLGTRAAAGLEPPGETCQNPVVRFPNLPDNSRDAIAVAGDWNALPRIPVRQSTDQQVYEKSLREHLQRQGIEAADLSIDQLIRIDLEGDGTDEVLIVSNRLRGSATMALSGDYAVVLLRKFVDGGVRQIPLEEEYYPEECVAECVPSSYRIAAVLDANGDGVMEVVTGFQYFEGRGKRIHALDRKGADQVLSWRCGT